MAKPNFKPVAGGIGADDVANNQHPNGTSGSGGSGGGSGEYLDPAKLGVTGELEGTGDDKPKRARKPRAKKANNGQLDLDTVKNTLVFAHFGLAGVFSAPEMALTEDQANTYAAAANDVLKYYDTGASAKAIAWVNLAAAAGGIYFQKFMEVAERKKAEKAAKAQAAPNTSRAGMFGVVQ